ncbi:MULTISPECIES: non-hydrolyzing UDP-N-acetylglucosamine 2-epimerase [Bacillus cereus group]|uniref:non-hydrolyzing UDP-N-acetylglucosamine 2-epimerase n=1 Tax=Bacillus cereus group TaxID=86661 RepID=UPI0022E76C51|nr:UDP-N-acetylglucosamine 2-epimerase (non-hydrolyzing) [Bacillus cereus group sp. TH152-1LC]MDA1675052.1 UDP-N-acetylglucosamine 2-epimerase (non-hydrolyzing) [Bacillus cereus group sp. TH152-1LC]
MKVMPLFGTRPEGIKMAPLVKELKKHPEITCVFVNTAQHREMLDQVLDLFDLKPDYDLDMMKEKLPLPKMFAKMVEKISDVLESEKPDLVLVHGDTLTTSAGALAAFYNQIPVGHVEAGLRTYDITSPFPEEANRQITGVVADIHFAATQTNKNSLIREGKKEDIIHVVGNSVIDALVDVANRPFEFQEPLKTILNSGLKTILMTTHRRENLSQLGNVYKAINRILNEHDDIQIIFPVHKNPAVRNELSQHLKESDRVHIIEPQDYTVFAQLMKNAHFILTDSGGIQEEAPALGKPVLVARNNTERPEGVEAGTLRLCGTEEESVYAAIKQLLTDDDMYQVMSGAKNPYGIGDTSQQIVDIILKKY